MAKLSLEPAEHTNRLAWRPPFLRFLPRFRAFLFARIKCAEHYCLKRPFSPLLALPRPPEPETRRKLLPPGPAGTAEQPRPPHLSRERQRRLDRLRPAPQGREQCGEKRRMDAIITGDIWKQVCSHARAAKRRLVAVAYVTTDGHMGFKRNDVLICDASKRAIRGGETSARLLHTLSRRGIEIRSRPALHAKVAVFGRWALVGSCNLSSTSADLTELALLTDRKQVVAQTTAFVHALRESSEEIDGDFLRRILKIKEPASPAARAEQKRQCDALRQ